MTASKPRNAATRPVRMRPAHKDFLEREPDGRSACAIGWAKDCINFISPLARCSSIETPGTATLESHRWSEFHESKQLRPPGDIASRGALGGLHAVDHPG